MNLKFFKSPYFLLCLVTFIWSSNFVVGKFTIGSVPPLILNQSRFIVAALILLPWYLSREKVNIFQDKKLFRQVLLLGLTGVCLFNTILYLGLQYTTAINSMLINALSPMMMVLFTFVWLKEKATWQQVVGLVISLGGVIWIASKGSLDNLLQLNFNPGDVLIFLACIVWTVYSVTGKVVMAKIPPMETIALATFFGAIMLIPFSTWEIYRTGGIALGWNFWLAIAYLGIFPSIVAHFLWLYCIKEVGVNQSANFYNLIPVFGAFLAIFFLNEKLFIYQVGGGLLVLLGIYFSQKRFSAQNTSPAAEVK